MFDQFVDEGDKYVGAVEKPNTADPIPEDAPVEEPDHDEASDMGSIDSDDSNEEEETVMDDQKSTKKKKLPKFPKFKEDTDMENPIFRLGQIFNNNTIFKQAVKEHAIREGRKIRFMQNELGRVRAVCTFGKCPWKIFASKFDKKNQLNSK